MSSQNNTQPLLAHNSADDIRRQIDQSIQKMDDKIRALKTQRNTLAPISRLPPEILAKIFALTISDALAYDALDWVEVSYVSSHWRRVALGYPSLWGNPVLACPKWCEEMLKRSKMAGLAIKADLHNTPLKFLEAFNLTMRQGSRIHELQLHCSTNTEMENLLLTLQVPMIRSLSLSIGSSIIPSKNRPFTLPKSILSGETPYLCRLDLRQCDVAWDISLFNGLVSLTIHSVRWSVKPTIEQLQNTLSRMPALEVLDLKNVVPVLSPGTPALSTENSIKLTKLTDLVVVSTVSEYVSLLSLVKIPTTTRIDFYCTDSDFSGIAGINPHTIGTSNIAEHCEGLTSKRVIRILNIELDDADILVFNGWSTSRHPRFRPRPDVQLRLPLQFRLSTDQIQPVIIDVCGTMDLQQLRSLSIALPSRVVTTKTWIDVFGTLPQLHTIHVEMESTHTLMAALHDSPPKPSASNFLKSSKRPMSTEEKLDTPKLSSFQKQKRLTSRSPYFPNLEYLTMRGSTFDDMNSSDPGIRSLRNRTKQSSLHKAKLQELQLRECRYLHEDVESLKEVTGVC